MFDLGQCCTGWSQPDSWTTQVQRTAGTEPEPAPGTALEVLGTALEVVGTALGVVGTALGAAGIAPGVVGIAPEAAGSCNLLVESIVAVAAVVGMQLAGSSLEVGAEAALVSVVAPVGEQTRVTRAQAARVRERLAEECHTRCWVVGN